MRALRMTAPAADSSATQVVEVTVAGGLGAVPGIHDLLAARRGSGKHVVRVA
jgi:hypothetical protein